MIDIFGFLNEFMNLRDSHREGVSRIKKQKELRKLR